MRRTGQTFGMVVAGMVGAMGVLGLLSVGTSAAYGQCNRGGGGGRSAGGSMSPMAMQNGISGSAQGLYNPLMTSPMANYMAMQYQSQLARQQALIWQNQQRMQQLAALQQIPATPPREAAALPDDESLGNGSDKAARRAEARQRSARKLIDSGQASERAGNRASAERNYRRALRMLADDSDLADLARQRLARLSGQADYASTRLAASE
ncbi:MAG: hypothetical protein U0795_04785 [Pirellulales bacterium]